MLVTGLEWHECYDRYRDLFGQMAHDYMDGCYDDTVRQRANKWWRAFRLLRPVYNRPVSMEPP